MVKRVRRGQCARAAGRWQQREWWNRGCAAAGDEEEEYEQSQKHLYTAKNTWKYDLVLKLIHTNLYIYIYIYLKTKKKKRFSCLGGNHPQLWEKSKPSNTSNKTSNFMNLVLFLVLWQQSLRSDFKNSKQMATSLPPSPSILPAFTRHPKAGCQQSYIYPSSRSHPRSKTSKEYPGTRTHQCSGISSAATFFSLSRMHTNPCAHQFKA